MADYVVLRSDVKNNGAASVEVIVRVDVPAGVNAAGVPWQTAMAQWRSDRGQQGVTRWPGASSTDLDDGSRYEFDMMHRDNVNVAGLVDRLEAAVLAREDQERNQLQERLNYWGRTGTVT